MEFARRELLLSSAPLFLLPGCAEQDDQKLILDKIELLNTSENEKCVIVEVEEGGNQVYQSEHCLASESPDNIVSISENWDKKMAQYDVKFELIYPGENKVSKSGTNALRGDLSNIDCFEVSATIRDDSIELAQRYFEEC